jgi:CBS domain-containing protein
MQTPQEANVQRPYKSVRELLAQRPPGVYAVDVGATVLDALRVMAERNIGAVVVLDGETLAGILSERDYARKGIIAGRTARETPVREMMTSEVVCVTPAQTVSQCMALMTDRRIRHLPVLENGTPIGILSIGDLLKEIVSHHEHVIKDMELEKLVLFARGTYSC